MFHSLKQLWKLPARVLHIERQITIMAATQADLDAAIDALPAKIESAVDAGVKPIIDGLLAKIKAGSVDFQAEIDKLNGLSGIVADQVTKDMTPAG